MANNSDDFDFVFSPDFCCLLSHMKNKYCERIEESGTVRSGRGGKR